MDQYSTDFQNRQVRNLRAELDQLQKRKGLGAALDGLRKHQVASGFIQDDLSEVLRFEFPSPGNDPAFFSAQYNPARARRFGGRGVNQPPPGTRSINNNCFLCAENIEWQQRGAEVGYPLGGRSVAYTAWMNPFPLAVGHTVVAADEHIHQHWSQSGIGLGELLTDLIGLADRLPGWITFYNGVGAGASIETHLHYHALPRTPGLPRMPIEYAADRHRTGLSDGDVLSGAIATGVYPLDFAHWRGTPEQLLEPVGRWLDHWQRECGGGADTTANAIAVRHADSPEIDVYFVPRVRSRSRAEGFDGVIGAFETMGEIICSTPDEKHRMQNGSVDYAAIADLLRHVSVAL